MSRNIRISRLGNASGLGESTPCRNRKVETLAAKTTTTKALLALVLIFSSQSAWSYTVSGNTYTTNGSQSDVQAACTAAPDNGSATVLIPNGTYSWSGNLKITRALTLAGQSSGGVTINNNYASGVMLDVTSSANGHVNIYWLTINQIASNGSGSGYAVQVDRTEPSSYTVLIHDCRFNTGSVYNYMVHCLANGIIFWNDTFIGSGSLGLTGISFVCQKYGFTSSWNTPDSYGVQDTTGLANSYVENCTFYDASTACSNWDDNSRVVTRYSTISNCQLGNHGQETSIYGVREFEVYNNTFIYSTSGTGPSGASYPLNMNNWALIRGGAGVFFGNAMPDIPYGKTGVSLTVFSINRADSIPCQTAYPAARQTGQGWSASSTAKYGNPVVAQDGIGAVTEGVYIWGNTGTETTDPGYVALDQFTPDQCGNGQVVGTYLQQNRDYFVNVAKPNYTPYTYPHPLHSKFALSGGTSTPTPTATPNSTPLPPQNLKVQ